MITIGIDIGSISTKAVLIQDQQIIGSVFQPTGYNTRNAARQVFEQVLERSGFTEHQVRAVVTTGYGRNNFDLPHKAITEITCHAAGACFLDPQIASVIDIGGQDAKALRIDRTGRVLNFVMNDKCAAGTGRFLEVMARALEVDLERWGELSLQARQIASISSKCTVFAESEVISLISMGTPRADIMAGIHASIAGRISSMAHRAGLEAPIMMTGGVAKNKGVVKAIETELGLPLRVDQNAQLTGAIGAALLAAG